MLTLLIANDVRNAMCAAYVTSVASAWFDQTPDDEKRRRFKSHPSNSIIYSGLKALEGQSVVRVHEMLADEHGLHPIDAEIRGRAELRLHRLAASHPATVKWRDGKMQTFADADRDLYDWRAAILWDVQRALNEELVKIGRQPQVTEIPVSYDMAVSLHAILDLSREAACQIPTAQEIFVLLQRDAAKFQAQLEKHPDGGRDRLREEERLAKREHRRNKWREATKGQRS